MAGREPVAEGSLQISGCFAIYCQKKKKKEVDEEEEEEEKQEAGGVGEEEEEEKEGDEENEDVKEQNEGEERRSGLVERLFAKQFSIDTGMSALPWCLVWEAQGGVWLLTEAILVEEAVVKSLQYAVGRLQKQLAEVRGGGGVRRRVKVKEKVVREMREKDRKKDR
ncbi:hypothetical protein PoB_004510000 [Plakobranchus ocellatus]|uniref:Uncharacterized protein n=1 Tax=Plakobranchus ocellatus TaxID=259542 RepID=A0AAV4BDB2_9GAST|nr:hypothetical protein PoB_004510000 [Plakobranchus ocellatus]